MRKITVLFVLAGLLLQNVIYFDVLKCNPNLLSNQQPDSGIVLNIAPKSSMDFMKLECTRFIAAPPSIRQSYPDAQFACLQGMPGTITAIFATSYLMISCYNPDLGEVGWLKILFLGGEPMQVIPRNALDSHTSFFLGPESSEWCAGLTDYREILYQDLYQGVNLTFSTDIEQGSNLSDHQLKYEFQLQMDNAISSRIENIKMSYEFAPSWEKVRWELSKDGKDLTSTCGDRAIYQDFGLNAWLEGNTLENLDVPIRWRLDNATGAMESGYLVQDLREIPSCQQYSRLVIDPFLNYSTFLGGAGGVYGTGIAVDSDGCTYVTGTTGPYLPTTPGAYCTKYNGSEDVFVSKFDNTGDHLIYSTFIGGSGQDVAHDISVDSSGCAYITGRTGDDFDDYPTTPGAINTSHNGLYDVFVTKLNANGAGLNYSTLLGGSGYDAGASIAVGLGGHAFITGYTANDTQNFPTTAGAFNNTNSGGGDAFVAMLDPDGSALVFSTMLGGSGLDEGISLAVDDGGYVYVTGFTSEAPLAFPTTIGAYNTTHNGGFEDVFVTKLNPMGATLNYSTLLGGSGGDQGWGIAIDSAGCAYITGNTAIVDFTPGHNFPVTLGAYDVTHNGIHDVFAAKLNAAGSDLLYATFLGGSGTEYAWDITVDGGGCAYVTGYTQNATINFPTTPGAFSTTHSGDEDAYLSKLNEDGSELIYSTYLGGSDRDEGFALALDANGCVFMTGMTNNGTANFPSTPGAYQPNHGGVGMNAFVVKTNSLSDADHDGLLTFEELEYGSNPTKADSDDDGLTDFEEIRTYSTSAIKADSDSDGLSDYEEIIEYGSNATAYDTDYDGLTDYQEIVVFHTNYSNPDTDSDGLTDFAEVAYGTNPLSSDTDGDQLPDAWEIRYGTNAKLNDSSSDLDRDGLSNLQEYELGTNPALRDTDQDGYDDGDEVANGTNPLVPDPPQWGEPPAVLIWVMLGALIGAGVASIVYIWGIRHVMSPLRANGIRQQSLTDMARNPKDATN